jgi:putative FmdB family regulatory protein
MPLYEYACKQCNHEFELLVRNAEPPVCPACQGHELERRLSVFAAHTHTAGTGPKLAASSPGACGTCGDPRGPGACSMN